MPIVKVNGIHIYYDLQGSENLPCLVLNNGILMNAATGWKLQEEIFSKSYRLLKYDFRGQGDSEHPKGEYTMELHTDDLAELMTNLNIKKKGTHSRSFLWRCRCSSICFKISRIMPQSYSSWHNK
ncbi:MAG: alpha/beta fold hydrolase [Dolichospermum sp.]|jgi:3-oxoadipate enol-lactonase